MFISVRCICKTWGKRPFIFTVERPRPTGMGVYLVETRCLPLRGSGHRTQPWTVSPPSTWLSTAEHVEYSLKREKNLGTPERLQSYLVLFPGLPVHDIIECWSILRLPCPTSLDNSDQIWRRVPRDSWSIVSEHA